MEPITPNPNQAQNPAETGLYDSVQRLLNSEEVSALPEADQGPAIIDAFIGELVAQDGVVGSDGERKSPVDILDKIDQATVAAIKDSATWANSISELTRTDGLRQAVDALANDSRTGDLFGSLRRRVEVSEDGKHALTTLVQVNGYLVAKTKDKPVAPAWKNAMLQAVHDHAVSPQEAASRWKNDLLESDVEGLRKGQLEFTEANRQAAEAGVDSDLLARSAEAIKDRNATNMSIGNIASAQAIESPPNFDHLFKP